MTIHTTEPARIIVAKDTLSTIDDKITLKLERKNTPFDFIAQTDSTSNLFSIDSRNSSMYYCNLLVLHGLPMLIDRKNPKRFAYPQKIYINPSDTTSKYSLFGKANNQGELFLHFSLPQINSFRLTPENEGIKINTGFWGLSLGLDYYHHKNQFINLSTSGVTNFFFPIPVVDNFFREHESMLSLYASISNNHKLNRFSFGYGISYSKNIWEEDRSFKRLDGLPPPTKHPAKIVTYTWGLVFPFYYQKAEKFHFGIIYRPTFYKPASKIPFEYEHLISIDFAWKIRLRY